MENKLTNIQKLFSEGDKVRCRVEADIMAKPTMEKGYVKEVYADHIIVHLIDMDLDMWYEEGFNLGSVYPEYNFKI